MLKTGLVRHVREAFAGRVYQVLAMLFCVLFGIAMIVNTQMSGEMVWFWYTTLFHGGAKLYADLHLALQPLHILETNSWMLLFGHKTLVTEIPSVLYILAFAVAILLLLRESDWQDWQKAIVLAGGFVVSVQDTSFRFDDYHIEADTFIFYSLVLLLWLARGDRAERQFGLAAALGILSGLTITTRLNDGAALLTATGVCLLVLSRKRKIIVASIFVIATVLTVVLIVKLTGDTLSAYVSNSIIRAADSKGGAGSILAAPLLLFGNALEVLRRGGKSLLLSMVAIVAAGALMQRYWKEGIKYTVVLQLGIAAAAFGCSSSEVRQQILTGTLIEFSVIFIIVVVYLLTPVVLARYLIWKTSGGYRTWDAREILVLLPLAELASSSASTAGLPRQMFYPQTVMLLLLIPVIQPFPKQRGWTNASCVTILALLGFTGMTAKIHNPYSWNDIRSNPMFVNRQWYRHPVYGPLYIDRDQLRFSESICVEIGQENPRPELLSLPLPYANYFCAIQPWHDYVQTFFDISSRATVDRLRAELDSSPPQWIVYQRELRILSGAEQSYNHGQPLVQRDLDNMIMRKIAVGEWQLVDRRDYSPLPDKNDYYPGDGWYVIRTRP